MSKGEQKTLTVKWLNAKKRVVMFKEEEEEVYTITDAVKDEYLTGIDTDTKVNVTTIEDTVTFIQPVKAKEEKKETKTETSNDDVKKWTIAVVDKDKTYIGFEESKKDNGKLNWYVIPENVKSFIGDVTKDDVVEVKIGTVDGKGKGGKAVKKQAVLFVKKVGSASKEEKTTDTKKTSGKSSYRDEEATDKRTASMNAKDVVVALINNKIIEKDAIKTAIEDLTKKFYEVIKNL